MFVKPAPRPDDKALQRKVRIPHTHALLANGGEDVPDNGFWLRRIAHGDVVPAERPKPPEIPEPVPMAPAAPEKTTEPGA